MTDRPDRAALLEAWCASRQRAGLEPDNVGGFRLGFAEWYDKTHLPPLPPEPPNNTICRGRKDDLWRRDDSLGLSPVHWHYLTSGGLYSYRVAVENGMQPTRRLVELPDPDDDAAMVSLVHDFDRWGWNAISIVRGLLDQSETDEVPS